MKWNMVRSQFEEKLLLYSNTFWHIHVGVGAEQEHPMRFSLHGIEIVLEIMMYACQNFFED